MALLPPNPHVRKCPYCGVPSQFFALHTQGIIARDQPKNEGSQKLNLQVGLYNCLNCGHPITIKTWGLAEVKEIDVHPLTVPDIPSDLPSDVKSSYSEAQLCFGVKAWRATAVMCRRTIQEATVFLNATGNTLFEQIEDLAQKQIIAPDLKDWAHHVRLIGKDGAHADVPKDVTEPDARDSIDFTTEFLNYVFVLRERLKKKTAKP